MTQQEKDKLHIKKQNRRYQKLILGILSPLLTFLILIAPLLIIGTMEYCATPSEPITVTYADCRWEGGRNKRLVLYTTDNKQWILTRHLRAGFYSDVKDGRVVPGEQLTITWYPWILRDAVATLSSSDTVYGDLDSWHFQQKEDARRPFILSAVVLAVGLSLCGLICYSTRRELSEIRKLKQKYRRRMAVGKGDKDDDA